MADDLRSVLAGAIEQHRPAPEPVEAEKPVEAPVVAEREKAPSGDRPRGPDGKFLPKDEVADDEEPIESSDEEPEDSEEPEERAEPDVAVPQHWSQSDKDMVAALPAQHRATVVERFKRMEAGFTPKLQRAAQLEKDLGGIAELFAPATEMLKQRNVTPTDVVRGWANIERDLMSGGQGASQVVARIIQQYRIDPGQVAAILQGQIAPAQAEGQGRPQSTEAGLPPEIAARLQRIEEAEANRIRWERERAEKASQDRIDAFVSEKDASGNLAHPHFADLESDISALARMDLSQGKTPDLADLYDRAMWVNREVREKLLSAQADEQKRKAAADRKAKAAKAQQAASSVTGTRESGQSQSEQPRKARSVREAIEEAMSEADAA